MTTRMLRGMTRTDADADRDQRESAYSEGPTDRPTGRRPNPFTLPRGRLGRLAGWLMARTNMPVQRAVAAVLDIQPGQRLLEIGYGPGRLTRLLLDHTPVDLVAGVDPSPVMMAQARHATRHHRASGRVDLRLGEAAALPYPDGTFDHVVAVNTVAIWPDLDAGIREIHRVLRPGGALLIAWHSSSSPSALQRRLGLSEDHLAAIKDAVAAVFGSTERRELGHVVAFLARR